MMKKTPRGIWFAVGILIGIAIGAAIKNIGAGVAIGVALGLALSARREGEMASAREARRAMSLPAKKGTWLILAVVSLVLSRAVFFFMSDPEGPNLVVVIGLAAIIFAMLLVIYSIYKR